MWHFLPKIVTQRVIAGDQAFNNIVRSPKMTLKYLDDFCFKAQKTNPTILRPVHASFYASNLVQMNFKQGLQLFNIRFSHSYYGLAELLPSEQWM